MALTVITGIGACLGFYGRSKGAPLTTYCPYRRALRLRRRGIVASEHAQGGTEPEVLRVGTLQMYLVNIVRSIYETVMDRADSKKSTDDTSERDLYRRVFSARLVVGP